MYILSEHGPYTLYNAKCSYKVLEREKDTDTVDPPATKASEMRPQYHEIIILSVPPTIVANITPSGPVIRGTNATLVCEGIDGDPPMHYSWRNPGGAVIASAGVITVTFSSEMDYGTYTCTANNTCGFDTASVEVIEAGIHYYKD